MSAKQNFIDGLVGFYFGDTNQIKSGLAKIAAEIYDAQQLPAMAVNTITEDATLDAADVHKLHLVTADAVVTLPATDEGLRFLIINAGADGTVQVTVKPQATDMLMGSFDFGGNTVRMSGTDNKSIVNTKATAKKGDFLLVNADDSAGYYIEQGQGIWTEQDQVAKGKLSSQNLITANTTLTAADSGKEFNIATDARTFTLPQITTGTIGMEFLFRNTGADGAVALTISPNASDGINGSIANAAADSVASGVVNKNLVNTKATANKGDYVKIKAVALTEWYITGGVGIWASEA